MELFWEEAVAVAKSATLVPEPAGALTVMVTREGLLVWVPLDTVNEKVSVAGPAGAVKVGCTALALDSVTVGPTVWVQA